MPQLPLSVCVLTQTALAPVPQRVGRFMLGQLATQLAPAQVTVPFPGFGGHGVHALPQTFEPGAQLLHAPPTQLVPVGQAFVQLPQWALLVAVSTSQPVAALLSQLALGGLHVGSVHWPPTHPSTPPVMLHGMPQPPQLPTLVSMSISQPSVALSSQSAHPLAHAVMTHLESTHASAALCVLQAWPQPPQLAGSFVVLTHSALAAPALHRVGLAVVPQTSWQASGAPAQVAMPPSGVEHSEHVVPHELVDIEVSGTQVPLQLW